MPKIPGINHLHAVRALEKAGSGSVPGQACCDDGRHPRTDDPEAQPVNAITMGVIVRAAGLTVEKFRELL